MSVKILISKDDILGIINQNIYGQQEENRLPKTSDWGPYVGKKSDIPNINGFRKDVIDALKKLKIPIMRWGGCFMGTYNWKDGVGPNEKRIRRISCWGEESNEFGTDEFIEFCHLINTEPMICLNVSEPAPESVAWVEYCNYSGNTGYANLRKENGHLNPYNVKYWEIGNEVWSCGAVHNPENYADVYSQYTWKIIEIARLTPVRIELLACGMDSEWNKTFLESLSRLGSLRFNPWTRLVDHLVLHMGIRAARVEREDMEYYNFLAGISNIEDEIKRTSDLLDYYGKRSNEPKDIGIAITEWDIRQAYGWKGRDTSLPFATALVGACIYNIFNKYCKKVTMTMPWMMTNIGTSIIFTRDEKMVLTPLYHVCDMYREHMGNYALRTTFDSPILREAVKREMPGVGPLGATAPKSMIIEREIESLSVSSSKNQNGDSFFITIVNKNPKDDIEVEIFIPQIKIKEAGAKILTSELEAYNDFNNPEKITPKATEVVTKDEVLIYNTKAKSVNAIKIKI